MNIEPATYAELAKISNIRAVKEANGNISKIVELFSLVGDKLYIYSGNDDQIVPILSMGGQGVISVLSNVLPRETCSLCRRFFEGDVKGAAELQCRYLPPINALFSQVNPIPAKAAMGFGENYVRLPLTPMEPQLEEKLLKLMVAEGVNCGGSATDLPAMTPALARDFNVVDSFDTHAKIPAHFAAVDASAKESGHVGFISGGWDPGLFCEDGLALIAVVGHGLAYSPDATAKIFKALSDAGVGVQLIDQGSSRLNLILGVAEEDYEKAIRAVSSLC